MGEFSSFARILACAPVHFKKKNLKKIHRCTTRSIVCALAKNCAKIWFFFALHKKRQGISPFLHPNFEEEKTH